MTTSVSNCTIYTLQGRGHIFYYVPVAWMTKIIKKISSLLTKKTRNLFYKESTNVFWAKKQNVDFSFEINVDTRFSFAYQKKPPEISFIKGVQMYSNQEKQCSVFFFTKKMLITLL